MRKVPTVRLGLPAALALVCPLAIFCAGKMHPTLLTGSTQHRARSCLMASRCVRACMVPAMAGKIVGAMLQVQQGKVGKAVGGRTKWRCARNKMGRRS